MMKLYVWKTFWSCYQDVSPCQQIKALGAFKYDTPGGEGGSNGNGGDLERVGKSVRTVETEWEKSVKKC